MTHIVVIAKKGKVPLLLWSGTQPCPWNLQKVLREHNWQQSGIKAEEVKE